MCFHCQLRRFNSLGASVYIRGIYLHCNGDYCSRTFTGDKTKVVVEPCTLTLLTDQDQGATFESHTLTAVTGPTTLFLTICPSKGWSDCHHQSGHLKNLNIWRQLHAWNWGPSFSKATSIQFQICLKLIFFFTKIVFPSTRNQWIRSWKLHLFETALQSCQGPCPHEFG